MLGGEEGGMKRSSGDEKETEWEIQQREWGGPVCSVGWGFMWGLQGIQRRVPTLTVS